LASFFSGPYLCITPTTWKRGELGKKGKGQDLTLHLRLPAFEKEKKKGKRKTAENGSVPNEFLSSTTTENIINLCPETARQTGRGGKRRGA